MPEINLLKNELGRETRFPLSGLGPRLVSAIWGLLILEVVGYGSLFLYQMYLGRQNMTLDQRATQIDLEIGKLEKDREQAVSVQRRLTNLAIILNSHLRWSVVMDELEKYSLKQAVFENVEADEGNHHFILTGSVPTYKDLGKLMLGLKQSQYIKNVVLESSQLSESGAGGYAFNLEVDFDPALLLK